MSLNRGLKQMLESLHRAGLQELATVKTPLWETVSIDFPAETKVKPGIPIPSAPKPTSAPEKNITTKPVTVAKSVTTPPPAVTKTIVVTSTSPPPLARQPEFTTTKTESLPVPQPMPDVSASEQHFREAKVLTLKQRETALQELSHTVAACVRCQELAGTRTQTVFGVGNPQAQVMFIGEAPGADEDEQGEPFVGRAGQLLNKIITACGWQREELYICNILRCRPPGNRNPTVIEAGHCREYLDGQIAIVQPEYIVCWGTIAAQNLLGQVTPIGRMRGQLFPYGKAKVLCTYHPSYLLRNPSAKKQVWEDLQILLREMGIDPESLPSAK